MVQHFNNSQFWFRVYDIMLFLSLLSSITTYVPLFIKQIEGLVPATKNIDTYLAVFVFFLFSILTILSKHFSFAFKAFGAGILGTLILVFFFLWITFIDSEYERTEEPT